jgi:membrane protease YdiL (CAAX protease family)
MPRSPDRVRLATEVGVYVVLAWVGMMVMGWVFIPLAGRLLGVTATVFFAAMVVNILTLSIYEHRGLAAIGLPLENASARNLALGLAGGIGAACLVLAPPLAVGAARVVASPGASTEVATLLFTAFCLLFGAAGEEILFRGFAFQVLIGSVGAWATIIPVATLFAAVHAGNPGATWIGMVNTGAFGILFGYAFLRSRDLWLPIGLHFGWNFTLPLFGVPVSGLTIRVTGYEMKWSAGDLWSGGSYGPEASILATAAIAALAFYLTRAPIVRQSAPLADPPEIEPCEPAPPLPS